MIGQCFLPLWNVEGLLVINISMYVAVNEQSIKSRYFTQLTECKITLSAINLLISTRTLFFLVKLLKYHIVNTSIVSGIFHENFHYILPPVTF